MQSLERGKLNFCNNLTDLFSNCFDFLSLTFEFDYRSQGCSNYLKSLIEHLLAYLSLLYSLTITPWIHIVTWHSSQLPVKSAAWRLTASQEVSLHSSPDIATSSTLLLTRAALTPDYCGARHTIITIIETKELGRGSSHDSCFWLGVKSVHYNQLALEPWVILQDRLLCWGELAVLLRKMIIYFVDLDYPISSHTILHLLARSEIF